ncbi:hypothetical protein ACRTDU_02740 [Sunxiuqinia elliptica]
MKQLINKAFWMGICWLAFACSDEEVEPYGPDYKIDDFKLEVYNSAYLNDTIPADRFQLKLTLLSDNEYAQRYGLDPKLESKITGLQINLENPLVIESFSSENLNPYFLVEDANRYNSLYETIEEYITKEEIKSLTPHLVFTNLSTISGKSNKLISDTVSVEISVTLTLEDGESFSHSVKTVLIP